MFIYLYILTRRQLPLRRHALFRVRAKGDRVKLEGWPDSHVSIMCIHRSINKYINKYIYRSIYIYIYTYRLAAGSSG